MSKEIAIEHTEEISDYFDLIDEFSFTGEGYVIKKSGEFIGLIKGDESLENEDTYFIDEIRIIEQERLKGYGKIALELLKKELSVNRLEGVSVPEARGFWEKLGARFHERCLICPFNTGCKEREDKATRESCEEYDANYFVAM